MDLDARRKRLKFRAWHRGTREADFLIGGYFDRYGESWGEAEVAWFEALLDEDDVDVMGWAMGSLPVPRRFEGGLMAAMRKLDYVSIAKQQ